MNSNYGKERPTKLLQHYATQSSMGWFSETLKKHMLMVYQNTLATKYIKAVTKKGIAMA